MDTQISKEDYKGEGREVENLPILITGEVGCGKSTLIANWIHRHKISHKLDNDYFVIRFAGLSPSDISYEYLLYSIYNQLRVTTT